MNAENFFWIFFERPERKASFSPTDVQLADRASLEILIEIQDFGKTEVDQFEMTSFVTTGG